MTELDDIRKRVEGLRDLADMPISMLGITGDTKAQMGADIAEAALRIATEQEAERDEAVMLLREIRTFLINGIEMGYIYLPEDFDSASKTLPKLNDYLARQEAR